VTEEQYLRSCDYVRVLKTVRRLTKAGSTTVGRRKLRLLACGCWRLTFAGALIDQSCQELFDAAEASADGRVDKATLRTMRAATFAFLRERRQARPLMRSAEVACFGAAVPSPVSAAQSVGMTSLSGMSSDVKVRRVMQEDLCGLVRDVFGNPYRPVAFLDEWRTSTAVGVATAIYEERAFDRLPILADALQDAGCEDAAVLDHCRGGGHHDRGCWVVDMVLKK
jgi:hypothetical protein